MTAALLFGTVLAATLITIACAAAPRRVVWWLHLNDNLATNLAIARQHPNVFTAVQIYNTNYSISAAGDLVVPPRASTARWVGAVRAALPAAEISVVLGTGHWNMTPVDPFAAAALRASAFARSARAEADRFDFSGFNIDWENGQSSFCRTLFQIERAAVHSYGARILIPAECSAVS